MSENNVEFKEPRRLTTWIKYLLYVQVAIALIAIGSNLMEYQLLTDFQNGVYFNQEMAVADAESNDKYTSNQQSTNTNHGKVYTEIDKLRQFAV